MAQIRTKGNAVLAMESQLEFLATKLSQ
jgi:hypothetical protein